MSEAVTRMPYDETAEQSVLGAMSMDPGACLEVLDIVSEEDFYLEPHKLVYRVMVDLLRREQPCDFVVLGNRLREEGYLERVGGISYLSSMVDSFPDVANVGHYARIVKDKSLKRQLMALSTASLSRCESDKGDAEGAISEAQDGVYRLAEETGPGAPVRAGTLSRSNIDLALALSRGEQVAVGLSTGWPVVDKLTGGLFKGEVLLIGARPSVGKSSFAIDMARRVAASDKRVLYLSLEMNNESLNQKMLASMAKVNSRAFRQVGFELEKKDFTGESKAERLEAAAEELDGMRLDLWDASKVTPMQVRTRCRQMLVAGGLDLVVVDYVGLMSPDGNHRESHEGHSEISGALKRMAKELDIPVVACAQVNREGARPGKDGLPPDPLLSQISGSTSYEQDANSVLFLNRSVMDQDTETKLILAKSRMGETGTMWLRFDITQSRFDQTGGGGR